MPNGAASLVAPAEALVGTIPATESSKKPESSSAPKKGKTTKPKPATPSKVPASKYGGASTKESSKAVKVASASKAEANKTQSEDHSAGAKPGSKGPAKQNSSGKDASSPNETKKSLADKKGKSGVDPEGAPAKSSKSLKKMTDPSSASLFSKQDSEVKLEPPSGSQDLKRAALSNRPRPPVHRPDASISALELIKRQMKYLENHMRLNQLPKEWLSEILDSGFGYIEMRVLGTDVDAWNIIPDPVPATSPSDQESPGRDVRSALDPLDDLELHELVLRTCWVHRCRWCGYHRVLVLCISHHNDPL
jgi:hypothetical protein